MCSRPAATRAATIRSADAGATGATREAEQLAAAQVLGVEEVTFLRHSDGEVEVNIPFRRELALVIRRGRPDVVLTFDPWQRYQIHPDHRAVGQTALDAVAAARDHMYYPEQLVDGLTEHRVHNVYFFATDKPELLCGHHRHHRAEDRGAAGAHQPDSHGGLEERMRARARMVGQEIGVEYAEAFHYLPMMRPPALMRHPNW